MTTTKQRAEQFRKSRVILHCCGCDCFVKPRLTNGGEVYPHRPDLKNLYFWKCQTCGNYVGCHHKTKDKTRPKGCIPTPEVREARKNVHSILDPMWRSGKMKRNKIYSMLSKHIGSEYHTGNTRSVGECNNIVKFLEALESE